MDINILEWVGYAASLLVLISLLMSSIIKLRWINLIGSAIFCVYGFLIGSIPVGIMNGGIIIINIYYLTQVVRECNDSCNKPGERHEKSNASGLKIEEARLAHSDTFSNIRESANPIITKT